MTVQFHTKIIWLIALTAPGSGLAVIPDASDQCTSSLQETTPSRDFVEVGDGSVVRHISSGLEWQRCLAGTSWNETECEGSPRAFTWQEALRLADETEGWRLPNVRELLSIVERCQKNPALNPEVFPTKTNWTDFIAWTSSPARAEAGSVWAVSFRYGVQLALELEGYTNENFVWLVRGSE